MTRRERLERKLEKRQEWAEKAEARSTARYKAARAAVENIPFGQPILVGHHSERRHRAAIARSDANMSKCVAESKLAEYHESKAEGLARQLDRAIFSDDPDAIEAIEARIAEHEAKRELNNSINKIVRQKPYGQLTPEKLAALVALGLSETTATELFAEGRFGGKGIPSYVNQNLGGRIQADRKRLEAVKARQQVTQAAEASPNGVTIRGADYVAVTFAEKPDREILNQLKAAGFHWSGGSWCGYREKLPASVLTLLETPCK